MKCDRCEQEATVHEVTIRGGKKVERHLCERCARGQGIAVQAPVPINELIAKHLIAQNLVEGAAATKAKACPVCGLTYAEFRQSGLLGCADCYKTFEAQLGPLLERAHEGGVHHVGKVPRRALARSKAAGPAEAGPEAVLGDQAERAVRLATLRRQLDEAVAAEQYERAARLRDELRKATDLEAGAGGVAGGGAGA